jgi:hypothetical protein
MLKYDVVDFMDNCVNSRPADDMDASNIMIKTIAAN